MITSKYTRLINTNTAWPRVAINKRKRERVLNSKMSQG